jgi:DNA-binding response OmpR family regulator
LVIDDEKYALELIEIYLQDEGFEVLTVQTEQEALKKFEQEISDVVIMDIRSKKCGGVSDY